MRMRTGIRSYSYEVCVPGNRGYIPKNEEITLGEDEIYELLID